MENSGRDGSLTCPGPRLCLGASHLYAGGCGDARARRHLGASSWRSLPSVSTSWDVLPNTPSRTQARGLARVVSGAFVGWMIATMHDSSGMFGAITGIAGAVIGTYFGHAARLAAIARIGGYPAAIVEDLVAIGLCSFHRHTLGPACILTPRTASEVVAVNAGDESHSYRHYSPLRR